MADTRVLLLSSQQSVLYHWRGRKLLEPLAFGADDAGMRAFAGYLEGDPATPLRILLDVVEEEFREETIPHVLFGDRRTLIRTRVNRLFRDPRHSYAQFQGRESEGRRDDRMLFSAITRPDLLGPWLTQISRYKVPLAGIHSLPLMSQRLLRHIPVKQPNALLVSVQSTGGLRQSFFLEQKLRMSRLAVMPRLTMGQYAGYILSEVERVRRYLNSLRLLTRDNPLDVYLLAQGSVMEDLRQQVTESVSVRFRFVELMDLARRLGARTVSETPYADTVLSRLLVRGGVPDHYGRGEDTRYYAMHQARAALIAASVLLLVGGTAWSGYRFVQGAIADEQTDNLARQARFYSERLRVSRAQLPEAPTDAHDIRTTVQAVRALEGYRTTPLPMMALVSRGLADNPAIQLDAMDWRVSLSPDDSGQSGRRRGREVSRQPPPDVEPGTRFGVALLRGRVEPFDGDYRLALDAVSNFRDTLAGMADVREVQAVSLPLDLSSERRLRGSTESPELQAAFELRVVVDLPPPDTVEE